MRAIDSQESGGAAVLADPLPVAVSRPLVLLRLGYRRPSQVPEKTARILDEVMEHARGLLAPRAVHRLVDVRLPEPGVTLIGGTLRSTSRSLHERLAACSRAVVFAATVGPQVEGWGHDLMERGEMTRALLADAYASAAAIALGLEVETIAARLLAPLGLTAVKRYAPGYGDWSLSDQAPLHALLDSSRIGITLTEDSLMLPAKSISGVIGGVPGAPSSAP
jgi:hypothetical protein